MTEKEKLEEPSAVFKHINFKMESIITFIPLGPIVPVGPCLPGGP